MGILPLDGSLRTWRWNCGFLTWLIMRDIETCRTGRNLTLQKIPEMSINRNILKLCLSCVHIAVIKKRRLKYDTYLGISIHVFGAAT